MTGYIFITGTSERPTIYHANSEDIADNLGGDKKKYMEALFQQANAAPKLLAQLTTTDYYVDDNQHTTLIGHKEKGIWKFFHKAIYRHPESKMWMIQGDTIGTSCSFILLTEHGIPFWTSVKITDSSIPPQQFTVWTDEFGRIKIENRQVAIGRLSLQGHPSAWQPFSGSGPKYTFWSHSVYMGRG